ncbi:helix-turn-helix domain-containing protein [Terrisporobacter glycolicus]|uniref:helix-turn-helix domain-containing protein n=1 Tax=Terrisporobacter petrolearius TaxID=1460447 RepID=UPI0008EB59C8|nr:Protein of unknown function [Terrisporobacter glycolicus]
MKINKLKGKLREKNVTYKKCADFLGLSDTTVNDKINGKTRFYIDEIEKLSSMLELTVDEKIDIFLN